MSDDEIDLGTGGTTAQERRRRRRERAQEQKSEPKARNLPSDSEVRQQLGRAFDGLASGQEAREDDELASAIREEADAMSDGIITLTRGVPILRLVVVTVLNVLITVLAFRRVGGILWQRFRNWRARRMVEQPYFPEQGEPEPEVAQ